MKGIANPSKPHIHTNKDALDKLTEEQVTKLASMGDVKGPDSAADGNLAAFDGAGGKTIKDSGLKTADVQALTEKKTEILKIVEEGGGGGDGDVKGPGSATDGNIAAFDGATGKIIKDGNIKAADIKELTDIKEEIKEIVESGGGGGGGGTGDGDVKGPASAADGELALYSGVTGKRIKAGGIKVNNGSMVVGASGGYHTMSFVKDGGFYIGSESSVQNDPETNAFVHVYKGGFVHIGSGKPGNVYEGSICLGKSANVTNGHAVQLGEGTNSVANSLQFRDFPVVQGSDGSHYLNTVGKVTDLKTNAKTDVVAAINELKQKFDDIVDGNEVQY